VAARHAAVPRPPPGAEPQHGSDVAVTGRTRTGRLDTDVVQPSRREEAAQAAAVPGPPPGPAPQQGFSVVVREQAPAGRAYSDIVQAGSAEEAVQAAAAQAAPGPPPGPAPRAEAAGRPRCARCLGLRLAALRAGGGTRPSAPGDRTWLPATGEVGEGRPWHCPSRTSPGRRRSRGFPGHAAIAGPGSRACRGAVHRSRLTGLPARHVARPVPIRDSLASGPGRIRGDLNGTAEPAAPGHGAPGLLEQAAAPARCPAGSVRQSCSATTRACPKARSPPRRASAGAW
jgi:hypothetical protein